MAHTIFIMFYLFSIPTYSENLIHLTLMMNKFQNKFQNFREPCNELEKYTKLAWGSCRTRAAMDRVLLYSETKDETDE